MYSEFGMERLSSKARIQFKFTHVKFEKSVIAKYVVLKRLEPILKLSWIDSNVSVIFLEIHTGGAWSHWALAASEAAHVDCAHTNLKWMCCLFYLRTSQKLQTLWDDKFPIQRNENGWKL